jgi:hypothetical protein
MQQYRIQPAGDQAVLNRGQARGTFRMMTTHVM